jgi:hypothetical protein
VRKLQRVVERALALADSDQLQLVDLPSSLLNGYAEYLVPSFHREDTMLAWGSRYVRLLLERCDNNKCRACRELGISYPVERMGANGNQQETFRKNLRIGDAV